MPVRSGPPRVAVPHPQQARTVRVEAKTGPLAAVPCPWCHTKMDFRALAGQHLGGMGEGDIGLEVGAVFSCDNKQCQRKFKIAALDQVTVVKVAPIVDRR
jgi:hypothetical protein